MWELLREHRREHSGTSDRPVDVTGMDDRTFRVMYLIFDFDSARNKQSKNSWGSQYREILTPLCRNSWMHGSRPLCLPGQTVVATASQNYRKTVGGVVPTADSAEELLPEIQETAGLHCEESEASSKEKKKNYINTIKICMYKLHNILRSKVTTKSRYAYFITLVVSFRFKNILQSLDGNTITKVTLYSKKIKQIFHLIL